MAEWDLNIFTKYSQIFQIFLLSASLRTPCPRKSWWWILFDENFMCYYFQYFVNILKGCQVEIWWKAFKLESLQLSKCVDILRYLFKHEHDDATNQYGNHILGSKAFKPFSTQPILAIMRGMMMMIYILWCSSVCYVFVYSCPAPLPRPK